MYIINAIINRYLAVMRLLFKTVKLRGGYQAYFFGNINFEIEVAKQGPYQHFGEDYVRLII